MRKLGKRGFTLTEVPAIGIFFVVIAIIFALGATILSQVQSTQTTDSLAYNITAVGMSSVSDLADWMPTWVVIVAAAVVIGIIGSYLMFRAK